MKVNKLEVRNEQELRDLLDKIYEKSQTGEHYYGILELIKDKQVFLTAIHNIKSNKGSKTAGIDKKIVNDYLQMKPDVVYELVINSINDYKPFPVKRVYIPKGSFNGKIPQEKGKELVKLKKARPLGIPAMVDRTIQEMVRIVLEPIFEAQFFPHSYGFRPYRSCEHAIAWILRIINKSSLFYLVEGDIKGYFDNINHNQLIETMWSMGIRDKRVLSIIKRMLKAGYMESNKLWRTNLGTPQGGIISPLLANIYLNNFDWMIGKEYEFHPQNIKFREKKNALASLRNQGIAPVFYVRYADDWVILTNKRENAERLKTKCSKYLKHKLKLELSEEKTLITDVRVNQAKFLGFKIKAGKQRFGELIIARAIPDTERIGNKVKEIKRDIRFIRTRKTELEKAIDIEMINSKIVGLSNYYKIGIAKSIFSAIDNRLENTAYKTWCKMYGKREAPSHKISVSKFTNRKDRHKGYTLKHFCISFDKTTVGLTFAKITPIKYAEVFKQEMSPYTATGRNLYSNKISSSARLQARPNLTSPDDLWLYLVSKHTNAKYNLEYFLNREYAFNKDKGRCKICNNFLNSLNYRCHHIDNKLPITKINRVNNLASVCVSCHRLIHGNEELNGENKARIQTYRDKLSVE